MLNFKEVWCYGSGTNYPYSAIHKVLDQCAIQDVYTFFEEKNSNMAKIPVLA
jgi:hypothetical protein